MAGAEAVSEVRRREVYACVAGCGEGRCMPVWCAGCGATRWTMPPCGSSETGVERMYGLDTLIPSGPLPELSPVPAGKQGWSRASGTRGFPPL